jgi:hypothetical protein
MLGIASRDGGFRANAGRQLDGADHAAGFRSPRCRRAAAAVVASRGAAGPRSAAGDGQRAGHPVEHDYVTRKDPVGIADLLAVEVPDFGPAPRRVGEALGDVPEGVAAYHDIAVRRVSP